MRLPAFLISKTLFIIAVADLALLIACSVRTQSPVDAHPTKSDVTVESSSTTGVPLRTLADIPLTGGATRLDYQSLDSATGRLYIAHLGSDLMTVFDVNKQIVVGDVRDLKRVHGVLAV